MEQGAIADKEYEEIYGRSPMEDNDVGVTLGGFAVPGGKILFGTKPTLGWSNIPQSEVDEFVQKGAEKRERERGEEGKKVKTEK
jgi:hypothetical protein